MGFPSAGDEVYRNEAGEPVGWGKPESAEDNYCDDCGFSHGGECPDEPDYDEYDEDEEYDAPIEEHDPGPEVDDEGGMSEHRWGNSDDH